GARGRGRVAGHLAEARGRAPRSRDRRPLPRQRTHPPRGRSLDGRAAERTGREPRRLPRRVQVPTAHRAFVLGEDPGDARCPPARAARGGGDGGRFSRGGRTGRPTPSESGPWVAGADLDPRETPRPTRGPGGTRERPRAGRRDRTFELPGRNARDPRARRARLSAHPEEVRAACQRGRSRGARLLPPTPSRPPRPSRGGEPRRPAGGRRSEGRRGGLSPLERVVPASTGSAG